MKHLSIMILATVLIGAQPARAQVTPLPIGTPSSLFVTTPLGVGPGASVPPVGVPLGATQLSSPGVSPALAGVVPQNAISGNTTVCSGTSTMAMPSSTPLFDASAGTVSGTCAIAGASTSLNPAESASSPTGMGSVAAAGRVGIPMGASELDPGGLSLPPPYTSLTSSLPVATATPSTPLIASPSTTATPSSSATMSPLSGTSQTSSTSCVGMPGNINSNGSSAGSTAGVC